MRLTITILLWFFTVVVIAAPVYKWTDSSGVTHYTQEPPSQGNAQTIVPQVIPGVGPERARDILEGLRKDAAAGNAARIKDQEQQAKLKAEREEREARARRCQEARANLEGLHYSPRVAVKDAQGEYRRIDDDERASLTKRAEALIQKECK
ncbi:putative DUF4124 domain-containing protein [Gammaproteobacteria bacterium]